GGLVDGDEIAKALAHFSVAIQALKDWQKKDNLLGLAFFLLKVAANQNVEELIRPAEFDIRFHHHRVPALHDRILNLVRVDRLLLVYPLAKVISLEHLLQRYPAV